MTSFDPHWNDVHKAKQWGRWPSEHLVRFVMRNYPDRAGLRALDIGCGGGAQSMFLLQEGFEVRAIDGSEAAIEKINLRAASRLFDGHRLGAQVADACNLPWIAPCFDLAVDVCCLQHLSEDDARIAIAETARVLKPGGKFFSVTARWSDTTKGDTPLRKMRREEVAPLYRSSGLRHIALDHEEYTERDSIVVVSHWLVAVAKQ